MLLNEIELLLFKTTVNHYWLLAYRL